MQSGDGCSSVRLRSAAPLTGDPDLHLLVDGKRLDVMDRRNDTVLFRLPVASRSVRIRSLAAAPQELGPSRDPRVLGVAVRRIVLAQAHTQRVIDTEAVVLADGYHAYLLIVHLGGTTRFRTKGARCG